MTATTTPDSTPRPGAAWALSDVTTMTWRNLLTLSRIREAIFFASLQPVIFVLLFRYVFGGVVRPLGVRYVDYMLPGMLVYTVTFASLGTAIALSQDMHGGLVDRFRALPMVRSAVLAGRTGADVIRAAVVVLLLTAVGYLVGFRVAGGVPGYLGGVAVLMVFAYALCWVFAAVGLTAPTVEASQLRALPLLFLFVFASSAFVPVETMPGWLQVFAAHQPITAVTDAVRAIMTGDPTRATLVPALLWSAALLAVSAPLAVRTYDRMS